MTVGESVALASHTPPSLVFVLCVRHVAAIEGNFKSGMGDYSLKQKEAAASDKVNSGRSLV